MYKRLEVFEKAHHFVLDIYNMTNKFPSSEKYRLVDQLIRASYSIPSNIIEGQNRNTTKDYINFLYNARGSASEIKYFLELSKYLNYITQDEFKSLLVDINNIAKMLNGLINSLKSKVR